MPPPFSPRIPGDCKFLCASLHRKFCSVSASTPKVAPANLHSIMTLSIHGTAGILLATRMHLPKFIHSIIIPCAVTAFQEGHS